MLTQCDSWPINKNWGTGSPWGGIGVDNFSVRWRSTAYISSGTYNFYTKADDGIRVWLDYNLIIDAWVDQAPTEHIATRYVQSGYHYIVVEYYENGGDALAEFRWDSGVPGIDYHTREGFHVFKLDRQSSNLSFEMVMARDSIDANQNPSPRETVSAMVTRYTDRYSDRNPVLAFNADYFDPEGRWGPQDLTVKNGTRLPNAGSHNGDEWRRSSISISSSKGIRIGKQTDCVGTTSNPGACTNWVPDSNAYYNTAGGGPLFVDNAIRIRGEFNGVDVGGLKPCRVEVFEDRYCNGSFWWTAVGVSQDGRYLIVVISDVDRTMDQAASILITEGAWKAMKLDSSSSTQAWYKGRGDIARTNGIANAIMVFSSQ